MSRRSQSHALSLQARGLRVVAITGGARGIGLATAQAFAREGLSVGIGDMDLPTAQAAAAQVAKETGAEVRAYRLDVADVASMRDFVDAVERDLGPIDVFDNNAGIMPVGAFLAETPESTRRQLDVNIVGVLNGVREIVPRFIERRSGHLINVASMAGRTGIAGTATYSGTKHFVVGFSEALRGELHAEGHPVQVSCVMPAVVRTELTDGLGAPKGVAPVTAEQVAEAILDAVRRPRFEVPVPRIAGTLVDLATLLPRRAKDGMARVTGTDHLMLEADTSKRRAYELRAGGGALPPATDGE